MFIYEVNLSIEKQIAEKFQNWLSKHVREILQLPGFVEAKICRVESDSPMLELSVCYILKSRDDLQNYFDQHAARFRQEGLDLFAGQFTAHRRILTLENVVSQEDSL